MKKIVFLLPILSILGAGISGCSTDLKSRITYGTYVDTKATKIEYVDLVSKTTAKENLLISVYEDSLPCGCWTAFHSVLDEYVETYHTKIYYIARSQFSEDEDNFGLTILKEGTNPTFAFIKKGKKSSEFIYGRDNETMFTTLKGLRSAVTHIARDPVYMMVDQAYLDNKLFTEKTSTLVSYIWSFCPDCNDCFPYVMFPYAEANEFKRELLIIDLGIKGLLIDDNNKVNTANPNYVSFLKEHHMSKEGDDIFGYDRGFVPTFQIWDNGKLVDMNVYFNDTVEKVEGKYKVTQSFFSNKRVSNLQYTNTVLEGLFLSEDDVNIINDSVSWNKDSARKYHQPLLESFLNMYAKK